MEIPNIKLVRFRVAITDLLMTPGGERGREFYGLERSPDNSLMVVCGVKLWLWLHVMLLLWMML